MLERLAMPARAEVEKSLLITLFKHNGVIREFSSGVGAVDEIADGFSLDQEQRNAILERIYRKENRVVKTLLWHRLLYRAADNLAKEKLVTRPATTVQLTNKREWMLTEKGFDVALQLLGIATEQKELLPIKSFEVQKEINRLTETEQPKDYDPIDLQKKRKTLAKTSGIRSRGFRHAVIESYDFRCCVCGLKIPTPDLMAWEVEAAHIVPHGSNGRDDVWNGIALCKFHHWAFDTGWFSLSNDCRIVISSRLQEMPIDFGRVEEYDFFRNTLYQNKFIFLPKNSVLFPHPKSLEWHRQHILYI